MICRLSENGLRGKCIATPRNPMKFITTSKQSSKLISTTTSSHYPPHSNPRLAYPRPSRLFPSNRPSGYQPKRDHHSSLARSRPRSDRLNRILSIRSSSISQLSSHPIDPNTKPPLAVKLPRKVSPSFKTGPFRGALLAETPQANQKSIVQDVQHQHSPSQLLKALKQRRFTPSTTSDPSDQHHPHPTTTSRSELHFPHSQQIKDHLEDLLYPLKFSEQLACRIVSSKNLVKSQAALDSLDALTPGGIGFAMLGDHNTKFSFIGRRMMHFALSDFLFHAPTVKSSNDDSVETIGKLALTSSTIENALMTRFVLGQYVGHQWELEKIMRWRELSLPPPPPPSTIPPEDPVDSPKNKNLPLQGTGLWTARGHVVEAIVGAVMTQFGTRLSIAVFNSLVLPHLSFRLDPSYLPAIKAVQLNDQELGNPKAGLIDWNRLDLEPFIDHSSSASSSPRPVSASAVS